MKFTLRNALTCALFAALSAISAFIKIPTPIIPITFQPLVAMSAGLLLGAKYGALSQALYVIIGLIGIPVFTQGGGPSYVLQPTFGYLLGFIGCAYVAGVWVQRKPLTWQRALWASLSGLAVLYLIGVPYLYFISTRVLSSTKPFLWAVQIGFFAPLPSDLLSAALLCAFCPKLARALEAARLVVRN